MIYLKCSNLFWYSFKVKRKPFISYVHLHNHNNFPQVHFVTEDCKNGIIRRLAERIKLLNELEAVKYEQNVSRYTNVTTC
jgi:hypothetical protein